MSDNEPSTAPDPGVASVASTTPAPEPPAVISQQTWDDAVGRWIADHIRSSAITQHSGAWNRLNEVLPKLHALLNQELGKKE